MVGPLPLYVRQPHFFANPWIDALRCVAVILAVLLIFWTARAVIEQQRRIGLTAGQMSRFICMGGAGVFIGYTEIIAQGTPATLRLPIGLVVLGFGFHGIFEMRQEQKRYPPQR